MSFLTRISGSIRPFAFSASRYYTTGAAASEPLLTRLKNDRKTLMKAKKQPDLNVVKSLLSDYTYYTKSANFVEGTSDEEALLSVLQKAIKRRQESAAQYESGGRPELAQQEKEELQVLNAYMPDQMNVEEIEKEVEKIIAQVGATSAKDMGKVMKAWKYDAAKADRKVVSDLVRTMLNK